MTVAIITGASRGLGRSAAVHLAKRGVDIIGTYLSSASDADAMSADVKAAGARAVAIKSDISDPASFPAFASEVRKVLSSWGTDRFDYLVNNAGVGARTTIGSIAAAELDLMYAVHYKGPLLLTQELLPLIRDGGAILNISSGLTRFSFPGSAAYASMKGALEVLTRYMARELGDRKIRANVLAPGAIETDFGGGHIRDNKQLNAMVASQTAMGRVGLPDDIGGAVAAILCGDTGWITAQRIEASGGMNV